MLIGMLLSMQVVNSLNHTVTALSNNDQAGVLAGLTGIAMYWVLARVILGWQNVHREFGWNLGARYTPIRLSELQFRKTHGELRSAKDGVSAEQIEIVKDKSGNIMYAVQFDGSETLAILLSSMTFVMLYDWIVGVLMLVLMMINCVVFLLVNHYFSGRIKQIDDDWRKAQAWTSERWNQFSLVKVTGMEEFVKTTMHVMFGKALDPDFKVWGIDFQIVDLIRSLFNIMFVWGVLCYGALYANWEIGLFPAMYLWLNYIKDQLWRIGSLQRHLIENTERVRAIREPLTKDPLFNYDEGIEYVPTGDSMHYELRGVSHRFGNGAWALRNVDLSINTGDRVALIGESGAGKSTIKSLLQRDFDPTEGVVLLDGRDIRDYALNSIQRYQGSIEQDALPMSGTVRDNLLFGLSSERRESVTDAELIDTVRSISQRFWQRLQQEQGLDSDVGKDGLELSGGERQRLSIARALLKQPLSIFIDEATSALDPKTETEVQAGIDRVLASGVTAVTIAHKFSTLQKGTKFVCLKPVSECGDTDTQVDAQVDTFEDLYQQSPVFRSLYDEQRMAL
jgi:ABC-type multidrug transport system fused ATPase/permease subunit